MRQKAAMQALAPAHSALVRQKGVAGQNLQTLVAQAKAAKGTAKGAVGKEFAQAKAKGELRAKRAHAPRRS